MTASLLNINASDAIKAGNVLCCYGKRSMCHLPLYMYCSPFLFPLLPALKMRQNACCSRYFVSCIYAVYVFVLYYVCVVFICALYLFVLCIYSLYLFRVVCGNKICFCVLCVFILCILNIKIQ